MLLILEIMLSKNKFVASLISLLLSMTAVVYAYVDNSEPLYSVTYSDVCPGVQGSRHTQVVYCNKPSLWGGIANSAIGCMHGDEDCYYMDPCHGSGWSSTPGGTIVCKPDGHRSDDVI